MKGLMMLFGMILFLLVGCSGNTSDGTSTVQLEIGKGVAIPFGYNLIEASAYGQFVNSSMLYLQQKENGRVYEYEDGKIGAEIVMPEGFSLVAVSAYGKFVNDRTFYCQKNGTNQIFICSPK